MLPRALRVRLTLEKDADMDAVLSAIEETLGHSVTVRQRLRTIPLLSVELNDHELARVREIPGVCRAEEEGRASIPPKPFQRKESQ